MEPPGVGLPADPFVMGTNFAIRAGEAPVHDIIQTASKEVQVSKVIQYIKGERQKNMAQLESGEIEKITGLEREIVELNGLALECARANNLFFESEKDLSRLEINEPENVQALEVKEKELQGIQDNSEMQEKKMECLCDRLHKQYQEFFPSTNPFLGWKSLSISPTSEPERVERVLFFKEQLLSSIVNRGLHLKNMRDTFFQNGERISVEFFNNQSFNRVDFFPEMGETHKCGKIATCVVCYYDEQEVGKLFYKPRDAEIDAAVIDLFREINHLPQDEQHTRPPLPEYKIMNCVSHDGSPASIWEYIEGDYPDCNIDDYVKKIPPENEKVKNCVKHLESVCRALGVSDLHRENIVVRSTAPTPTSFKHEIVPIDLENLQFGASTGMFSLRFQPPPLSDQEHALINQCREKLKDVLVRYVPLGTSDFLGALLDYRNCTKLTTHIIQQMKSDGYRIGDEDKFVSLQERLEFLMLQDLVRGDVPYCVVRR